MREGIFVVDADGHVIDRTGTGSRPRNDLSHQQKAKILGGNARGFYGMKA
jgi:hypothetical protein